MNWDKSFSSWIYPWFHWIVFISSLFHLSPFHLDRFIVFFSSIIFLCRNVSSLLSISLSIDDSVLLDFQPDGTNSICQILCFSKRKRKSNIRRWSNSNVYGKKRWSSQCTCVLSYSSVMYLNIVIIVVYIRWSITWYIWLLLIFRILK